jgi:hypothetical protein
MREHVKSRLNKTIDWMDCSPRKGWYIAVLLFLNYVWDICGHWPL